jgi:hypothetical protein
MGDDYGELWSGEMLFWQLFQMGLVGICFLFFFIPVLTALMVLILYYLTFQLFMTKRAASKREGHMGERHLAIMVCREKDYREEKIFSFKNYEKLDLHAPITVKLEETDEYKTARVLTMLKIKEKDLENREGEESISDENDPEEKNTKKRNSKTKKQDIPKTPENQETPILDDKKEKKSKPKTPDKLIPNKNDKKEEKLLLNKQYELIVKKFNEPEEEDETQNIMLIPTSITPKFNWNDLSAYIIELTGDTSFNDTPDLTFDRIVLLTRREFESEFHFSNMTLNMDDDIQIEAQAASAWMVRVSYLPGNIPLMLTTYTEKDIQGYQDIIINANAVKSIKEQILETMHKHMIDAFQKYSAKIDEADFFRERAEYEKEILAMKFRTKIALNDRGIDEHLDESDIFKLNWIQIALLGLGWIIAIILGFFI